MTVAIGLLIELIAGIFYGIMSLAGRVHYGLIGNMFKVSISSIILLPIECGVVGFALGALVAFLYNMIAKWTGGIEIDLDFDSKNEKANGEKSNGRDEKQNSGESNNGNESSGNDQGSSEYGFEEM